MTIAFGQGLNVAPLQAVMAVGALVNGGMLVTPTFLKRSEAEAKQIAPRVVKPETSESMRYLMRLNAEIGTAKIADIKGYFVGGKTGTADKIVHGHYSNDQGAHDIHGDPAGGQAEISLSDPARRAAGTAGDARLLSHRRP